MATTEQDFDNFRRFVELRLGAGESEASLDELFDLWRDENPSANLYAENAAAIAASIEDFKRGERGEIAGRTKAANAATANDLAGFLADEPELADQIIADVHRTRESQSPRAPGSGSRDS